MSCNCEYGKCDQSFGCPVRDTPTSCLKAGACETEQCETLGESIASTKEIGAWSAILFCLVAVLLLWLIGKTPILSMQFF